MSDATVYGILCLVIAGGCVAADAACNIQAARWVRAYGELGAVASCLAWFFIGFALLTGGATITCTAL